ncbi:hypothetical protein [Gluconobacter morbifer]|uniref:Endonuclease/exonuclease/phosphatase domain-containing protein n=1 Tax=Gluconobacter morbifer G707 TaxID=1088869 RepID=G6XG77_9PROT|nr:hypothetical protein [Gluconobacter morbifer]EHH69185.1 hypothetical protein GMO_04920 [Gluconobacter morbifer G707]
MAGHVSIVSAHDLKISTWNMDWLTLKATGNPALPDDVRTRAPQDFTRLRTYAHHLNADIVGFEEVDGFEAAARIFDPATYQLVLTPDHVVQRVGVAVRRGLHVTVNDELSDLNVSGPLVPHPLRGGLDVTVSDGKATLRLLVVHLKTGCWDQPLTQHGHSCPILYQQFHILEDWIQER